MSWPALLAILLATAPTSALATPEDPDEVPWQEPAATPSTDDADEPGAMALHQEQQAPHPRDWSFALQTGAAIGFFFPHYGRLSVGLERRFADRVLLEVCLRLGFADQLTTVEPGLRLGVLLHLARSWDLLLGWRLAYAGFHMNNYEYTGWAHAVGTGPMLELRYAISPRWELRLLSVELAGYWSGFWSLVLEPVVGMAVRF